MSGPFFSLVTPIYNIERLIGDTLKSALSQTCLDWEMICVDDGSPDRAGDICDEYSKKDARIKVIHKENEGLAEARNVGIRAATGKYIIILEGSDLFPNSVTLEFIKNLILNNNNPDILFARLQDQMEGAGEITKEQTPYRLSEYEGLSGIPLLDKLIVNKETLAPSAPVNKVYRRQFIVDNDIWFYKGIYHDDDEWLPRAIALTKKTVFTNEIIYSALTWDGCFGGIKNEKGIAKKSSDKMLIAANCCEDFYRRFGNSVTPAIWSYLIKFYIDGVASLNTLTKPEYINQVKASAKKFSKALNFAAYADSKNVKALSLINKFLGNSIAVWAIKKRYKTID